MLTIPDHQREGIKTQPIVFLLCLDNRGIAILSFMHLLILAKANCIDSTAPPEEVFKSEVQKLRNEGFKREIPKPYQSA